MANNLPEDFVNAVTTMIEMVLWQQLTDAPLPIDDLQDALTIAANYIGYDLKAFCEDSDDDDHLLNPNAFKEEFEDD